MKNLVILAVGLLVVVGCTYQKRGGSPSAITPAVDLSEVQSRGLKQFDAGQYDLSGESFFQLAEAATDAKLRRTALASSAMAYLAGGMRQQAATALTRYREATEAETFLSKEEVNLLTIEQILRGQTVDTVPLELRGIVRNL